MPVIQVEAQVSAEQILKAVEQMQEQEFEAFVTQVLLLRAQREAPRLSLSESELLLKINQGLDDQLQNTFNQLIAKRQAMTISDAELEELIQLTDRIEQLDAERIESLAKLARLRQRSLTQVMQDLNIQPPACV